MTERERVERVERRTREGAVSETEKYDAMTSEEIVAEIIDRAHREFFPDRGTVLPENKLASIVCELRRLRSLPGGEPAPFALPVKVRGGELPSDWCAEIRDADNGRLFHVQGSHARRDAEWIARALNAYASGARARVTESGDTRPAGAPSAEAEPHE